MLGNKQVTSPVIFYSPSIAQKSGVLQSKAAKCYTCIKMIHLRGWELSDQKVVKHEIVLSAWPLPKDLRAEIPAIKNDLATARE